MSRDVDIIVWLLEEGLARVDVRPTCICRGPYCDHQPEYRMMMVNLDTLEEVEQPIWDRSLVGEALLEYEYKLYAKKTI